MHATAAPPTRSTGSRNLPSARRPPTSATWAAASTGDARFGITFAGLGYRLTPAARVRWAVIKFVGISMENTARKLIEQSLQEEQARFRAVFALAAEPMAVFDGELCCTGVNRALAAWLGYPAAELEGERLSTLFGDGGECLREGARAGAVETALRHVGGAMLPARVSVRSERRADGSTVCLAVAIRGL